MYFISLSIWFFFKLIYSSILFIYSFIYLFILFIHLFICMYLSIYVMMKNGEGVYMYVSITLPTGSTSLHINIISDIILCLRPCKKSDTLNLLPHVRFAVWIRWVWPRCFSVTLACLPIYINEYICYCSSILLLVFGINPKKLSSEKKTHKNKRFLLVRFLFR